MAKRFVDTDLFRKPLVRGLATPYKLLWIYLLCECDHAGVWDVEIDVASMRLGTKLDAGKCIAALGSCIVPIDGGRKWWIPEFIAFQYGQLNPSNKVHASVLAILSRYGVDPTNLQKEGASEPLPSPLQGAKDMDKEKATDKEQDGVQGKDERFEALWAAYGRVGSKPEAMKYWRLLPEVDKMAVEANVGAYVTSTSGERLQYRKYLEGWINPAKRRWESPVVHRGPITPTERVNSTLADPTKPIETVKEYNARKNAERHGKPAA